MIYSENTQPTIYDFQKLMRLTDARLNDDALKRYDYYINRGGNKLEDDVVGVMRECAYGTPFEGSINKISGQRFPDIVAAGMYGVEVKSTTGNHWTSTGSSILETTRIQSVKKIYMTFGKLGGKPIEFKSKPYEECLSGIAVTHMPRYLIDMRLKEGETIFDKMGVTYDDLRSRTDPVGRVAEYYRKVVLKKGERLWWTGNPEEESVSARVTFWNILDKKEKLRYIVYGLVNYPEVFDSDFNRFSFWLVSQGVICPNVRDQFTAGGRFQLIIGGRTEDLPGIFKKVYFNFSRIMERLQLVDCKDYNQNQHMIDKTQLYNRYFLWAEKVEKICDDNSGAVERTLEYLYNGYRNNIL